MIAQHPHEVVFKRKFRYVFEGRDADGNIVFPSNYVKINGRPSFGKMAVADENGGCLVDVPGEFGFSQFLCMFESSEQVDAEYARYQEFEKVVSATLKVYDGCGNVLEFWDIEGIRLSLSGEDRQDEYSIVADWHVSYASLKYQYFHPKYDGNVIY